MGPWGLHQLKLGCAVAAALSGYGSMATAGGFNPGAGQGYLALSGTFTDATQFFTPSGGTVRTPGWRRFELTAYAEYGLTDWLAVIVKPGLVSTRLGAPLTDSYTGIGRSEWAMQVQAFRQGPFAVAIQAGFHLPGPGDRSRPARLGDLAGGGEVRLLAAWGFQIGRMQGFADVQAAYRLRAGWADEIHADGTLGLRLWPAVELRLQSFNVIGLDDPAARPRTRRHKLQAGVHYDTGRQWLVGLSMFQTLAGRYAAREQGYVLSAERRF